MTDGSYLPGEEAAAKTFPEKHRDLFSQGEKLLQLAFSFKPFVTMQPGEEKFFQAVIALCAKSIKTFRGIHLLCSHGFCDDALALSRTLLEILTSIKRLQAGDRTANAGRFWEFAILKTIELNNLFIKSPDGEVGSLDAEHEVQQFIRSAKSQMSEKDLKEWLKGSWHKRGVVPLASDLGLPSADKPYKFASSAIHASGVFHHFDTDSEGGLIMKCAPNDIRLRLALETSNIFFMAILHEVNAVCAFGLEPNLMRIFHGVESRSGGPPKGGIPSQE